MPTKMQSYSAASAAHNTLSNEQAEFYQKVMLKRLKDNVVCYMGKRARHSKHQLKARLRAMGTIATTKCTI